MIRNANRHENLARLIATRRVELGLSYADIARISGVDASQVNRICRGRFRNLSENVLQVCTALNIAPDTTKPQSGPGAIDEVLNLIGQLSVEDADRLIMVLQKLRLIATPSRR